MSCYKKIKTNHNFNEYQNTPEEDIHFSFPNNHFLSIYKALMNLIESKAKQI